MRNSIRNILGASGALGAIFLVAIASGDIRLWASDEAIAKASASLCGFVARKGALSDRDAEMGMQKVASALQNNRESCMTLFAKYGPSGTVRPGLIDR